ncbi:SDR family oxidoreductase [Amycolatopsis sp. H6(2020)]|nr:SDR family oxidoreductase [Amycolatopsis sp. H6(2020)]
MRVLVTGGQGYIGSVLSEALAATGYEVVVLDNGLFSSVRLELPTVRYMTGDIRDPGDWESALDGVTAVVHLAAVVGDPACGLDEDLAWETNYLGTIRVAEACRRHGVEQLVFASTCSTYGITEGDDVDVWSPLNPQSVYARTKVLAEHHLLTPRDDGPQVVILRLSTAHGESPRMRFDLGVNLMTAHAVAYGTVTVHGGQQWRPFLHVRDIAAAGIGALTRPRTGAPVIYNCGSTTENHTIAAVAQLITQEVAGASVVTEAGAPDPRDYRVNFDPIARHLGFRARFRVVDTIREVRDAMRAGAYRDFEESAYSNHLTLASTALPAAV